MILMFLFWTPVGSPFGGVLGAQMEAKSIKKRFSKVSQNYDGQHIIFCSILGSLWGSKMETKMVKKPTLAQVGVPEGPRDRVWKDFGAILELCWDDCSKVFGRISMLGLIVFKVLASSFWGRWWEISACCFHPFGYDLGVVWYGVRHVFFICLSMPGFLIVK